MTRIDQTHPTTEIKLRVKLSEVHKIRLNAPSDTRVEVPLLIFWKPDTQAKVLDGESQILNSQVDAALTRFRELLVMEPKIQDLDET